MSDGKFYLGKEAVITDGSMTDKPYLYKADHLTTHGMVFGMTGSGKTGLCIDLMEEALTEDIPVIIVDPKGDLSNLALLFPDLEAEAFKPWLSPGDATAQGQSMDTYAETMAQKWKNGLSDSGISLSTLQELKDKTIIRIFTPGSSAGCTVSVLDGFNAPQDTSDDEAMVEKIQNSVSALLALLDIDNDPLKSKPHILISNIITHYWKQGRNLSISDLIVNIQTPPIQKLGVLDMEMFINKKERSELAFKINNIIASPGFRFWVEGTPLSAETLFTKTNIAGKTKTPVNIFSIAHLPDNERMFFVTLLLNEIIFWMRKQPGSGNLKYLFYMDEIFGYLPPYPMNPPSKNPLLVLLKQARAFGLGVILATQNPKDIDYKALTNVGTWFIGKLQAEGDRERVLEGMSGITQTSGETIDEKILEKAMAGLNQRRFLVKNVHAGGLSMFQTRWTMSYLAGPVTRDQIKLLTRDIKQIPQPHTETPSQTSQYTEIPEKHTGEDFSRSKHTETTTGINETQPETTSTGEGHLLPFAPKPEMELSVLYDNTSYSSGYYVPMLYIEGEVVFDEQKPVLYIRKPFYASVPLQLDINWRSSAISEEPTVFSVSPAPNCAGFKPLPVQATYTILKRWHESFKNYLLSNLSLDLFINRELNLISEIGESQEAFIQRCRSIIEKSIDKEIEKLKDTYGTKIEKLESQLNKEQLNVRRLESEQNYKRTEEIISAGESVLGILLGGRSRRVLSSAARKRRASSTAADRLNIGKSKLEQIQEDINTLREKLEDEVAQIEDTFYQKANTVEPFEVRLEKNDILVSNSTLLWKLTR